MKEQKHSGNEAGLVVGNVSRGQAWSLGLKKYWKPLAVVAIILVAGGAGVGLRLLQNKNADQQIVFPGKPLPQKVDDAQNLRASGDIAGSAKAIEEGLANPNTPPEERYMLYIQQGNSASDAHDYQSAINSYDKAAAIKQTYEIYRLLGQTWAYAKDNAKAIEYYKKAIPLINAKSPLADEDKQTIEQIITRLQNGGTLEDRVE